MIEEVAAEVLKSAIKEGIKSHLSESIKETTVQETLETQTINPLEYSLNTIENKSLEGLKIENEAQAREINAAQKETLLSNEEIQSIKAETGWSDEILESIRSVKEAKIYENAHLKEAEINGRKCLIRSDIDWEQKDSMGRTNAERAKLGLSPINKNGETIELHHIGQKENGPLAELTPGEHRGKENYSILHDATKASEIDREKFSIERSEYWKLRAS